MAKQTINIGSTANDGTGSTIRAGGDIANDNFNEIYSAIGTGSAIQFNLSGVGSGDGLIYNNSNSRYEPSSLVITTTNTKTLENKTIALGSNTVSGTTAQFNAALSDGSFTTLAGSEALTNKTFNTTNTFPALSLLDESSTAGTVSLGGTLRINGDASIAAAVSGSTFTISLQSGIDATKIADGSVSSTEFQYLNGVTSNIQTQIDAISGGLPSLIAAIALG